MAVYLKCHLSAGLEQKTFFKDFYSGIFINFIKNILDNENK
jgi:hypothetical protein